MKANSYNRGFSLIELIVYLSLSIILFNVTAISFVVIERQKIVCCAKDLQNNLRYCQKNAVDEKKKYQIKITDGEKCYNIQCSGGKNNVDNLMRNIEQINLPVGIKLNSNFPSGEITYKKTGTIENGGTIAIYGKKYLINLVINVSTGRARLEQIQKK